METSTTSSDFTSGKSISTETIGSNEKNNYSTWLYILIVLALFGFLYFILAKSSETEHMSPGIIDQMFSQDAQDVNLSGGPYGSTDVLSSDNSFMLYWNNPTRVTNNRNMRGQLISTIPQIKPSKAGLVPLNTPGNLNSIENTVFPRVIPQSTVSTYPDINNILVNQKEDNDLMERQLSKQDLTHGLPPRTNTLRAGATNTLQNALVNSCQYCVLPNKCQGCPMCLNGLTSHPKGDEVASNKVDAKSVGAMSDDSEYMTLENFDSGLTGQTMPSRVHNQLKKRITKRQENFDSGLINQSFPSKVHDNVSNKILNKHPIFASSNDEEIENFSSLTNNTMPTRIHNKIKKKMTRRQENFDSGLINQSIPSKVHDNLSNKILNKYPIFASSNDEQIENFDSGLNNQCMPVKVQKKILKRINKKQENFSNDNDEDGEDDDNDIIYFVNEVNDGNENLVGNPLRASTNGCANCPQGRCVNCPMSNCSNSLECPLGYPCKSCKVQDYLNSRTTLDDDAENFSTISNKRENFDCPCRRKVITATNLNQKKFPLENFDSNGVVKKKGVKDFLNDTPVIDDRDLFSSVGFGRPCPCENSRCNNCPLCRAGNCPNCPKVKPTSTFVDLASFGDGAGGYRLGGDWNEPSTAPNSVDIGNGITFYSDSYVGSYWTSPFNDISYPYAVIPPSRSVSSIGIDFGNK